MVLTLKRWKSRTPPGIAAGVRRGKKPIHWSTGLSRKGSPFGVSNERHGAAGWSSPVARQAHNLKVVGSNPTPATTITPSGPPLRLHLELDNKRRMIARLHPPTWNPVNPRHNQTVA